MKTAQEIKDAERFIVELLKHKEHDEALREFRALHDMRNAFVCHRCGKAYPQWHGGKVCECGAIGFDVRVVLGSD